jgi:tetratricopeptide (TPR) repeat protein
VLSLLPALESALDRGSPQEALALCENALARTPGDGDALRYLGSLLAGQGRGIEAVEVCRRATRVAPADPRVWSDFGRVMAMQAQFDEAEEFFRKALSLDPGCADAWHNLGAALRHLGRYAEAFEALKQALLVDPRRAPTYLSLGGLLIESRQFDDALECFERAARLDPSLAGAQSRLAGQLAARGKLARAQDLFRTSVSLEPAHLEGWSGLGQALEDMGDAAGALGCYRNVLVCQPGHALALGRYLSLLRAPVDRQLLEAATAALNDAQRSDADRALIGYGLAKYRDRHGAIEAAAVAGREANAARRRMSGAFDREAFDARVDAMVQSFDRSFFAARRGYGLGTDQPVFIVGLPRSGTTLTEQIIASHPFFHGAGELPDLPRLAARVSPDAPWKSAALVDEHQTLELAREYLRALREGSPKGRLRITDKSPFNFFQLGLVALMFPQARVIHCRRNAGDNALSIWMENFNQDQRYATDFGDIAHLRGGYRRLMAHWHEVLPLTILDVDYEELVADTEGQARRIIDFLGAPWDRRCLDFHQTERAVQTPSRWQVRQKIYGSSVEKWRRYADFLPELAQTLKP